MKKDKDKGDKTKNDIAEGYFKAIDALTPKPKKTDPKYAKYASLNRRMIAASIDSIIAVFTIAPVVDFFLGKVIHSRPLTQEEITATRANPETEHLELIKLLMESGKLTELLLSSSIQIVILLLASMICWKFWSATPGKIIARIKIVDAMTEKPITGKQIILRGLGYIPSCAIFFLGIFWISFNKKRQGWHDKIAGTTVIIPSKAQKEEGVPSDELIEKAVETAASTS